MTRKRLSFEARRAQLLDVAMAIINVDGVDALTLARVAAAARVSKPLVYKHFETQSGLLKELFRGIDAYGSGVAQAVRTKRAHTVAEAARILAETYVDCVLLTAMEFGSVSAVLSLAAGADDLVRSGRERYAEVCLEALGRVLPKMGDEDKTIMLGVVGAAETLAREAAAGRLERGAAVMAISRIIMGAVTPVSASA